MAKMNDSTRLKIVLKANHMTQREFADWFCISGHAAWEVINGNRPLKDFEIVEICKRFNVSADWLLGLCDERVVTIVPKEVETSDQFQRLYSITNKIM